MRERINEILGISHGTESVKRIQDVERDYIMFGGPGQRIR
jgi:hypothetical protein